MRALFPFEVADKLLDAASEAGVARAELLAAAGVEEGAGLDHGQLCLLYETAARLTGDDAFGLHVGERTRPQMYGMLGYVAVHNARFGEALERLVEFQPVWSDAVRFELSRDAAAATISYRLAQPVPAQRRRQESEQMMAALLAFARTAVGDALRPVEVRFEHGAPADVAEHKRVFGCPLLFAAAATEMVLPAAVLASPMAEADPRLGALIRPQAEAALADRRLTFVPALRLAIRESYVGLRRPVLAAAARALAIGPRTLQRRLREQGLSWRGACDEVRIALAKEWLADPRLGLAQIAHRLGFSQASAFHRAFRRLAGTTPRRYRAGLRARAQRR